MSALPSVEPLPWVAHWDGYMRTGRREASQVGVIQCVFDFLALSLFVVRLTRL